MCIRDRSYTAETVDGNANGRIAVHEASLFALGLDIESDGPYFAFSSVALRLDWGQPAQALA